MRQLLHFTILSFLIFTAGVFARGNGQYWAVTHQWSSNGTCQTEPFKIFGTEWRIKAIYDSDKDMKISYFDTAQQKFISLSTKKSSNNQNNYPRIYTFKEVTKGDKFLAITSKNDNWTILVEEYIDHVSEWQSIKNRNNRMKNLTRLGTWSDSNNKTITFDTTNDLWLLKADIQDRGLIQIEVLNPDNEILLDTFLDKEKTSKVGYFFAPGKYTIKVKSTKTAWILNAFQPQEKALIKPE